MLKFVLLYVIPALAAVLLIGVEVSPRDAVSHLGAWWYDISGQQPPNWLAHPIADNTAVGIGSVVISVWVLWHLWHWFAARPLKRSASVPRRIPLHKAARYLAQSSKWASDLSPNRDNEWVTLTVRELQSSLAGADLPSWGYFKPTYGQRQTGPSPIPPDFWQNANWHSEQLVDGKPPVHIWRNTDEGGGQYDTVMVDEDRLRELWPERSGWRRILGRSPIDRINRAAGKAAQPWARIDYRTLWKEQDIEYPRTIERFAMEPWNRRYGV